MIKLERCYVAYFKNHPNVKLFANEHSWKDKPILIWVKDEKDVDPGALQQLLDVASLPFIFRHVAAMPDIHKGYGITIGGVVACDNVVVPYFVGKDKGCGMRYISTNLKASNLTRETIISIRRLVRKEVPIGMGKSHDKMQDWDGFDYYWDDIINQPGWFTPEKWRLFKRSLGTLGGGNHFMEIQETDEGNIGLMIHSGSRNLGSTLCDYHHNKAKEFCEKYHAKIPNPECSFFPADSNEGMQYITDMNFALAYAKENRKRIMAEFKKAFVEVSGKHKFMFNDEFDVHHNYAALENHFGKNVWVHRKGATSAKAGELGIIPGSQGSSSYIVKGLGNRDSFMSCSHGAGRRYGRNAACKELNLAEETAIMKNVVFDSYGVNTIKGVDFPDLQEATGAYKDIDKVMANQTDLVEIITELKPLGSIKAKDIRKR